MTASASAVRVTLLLLVERLRFPMKRLLIAAWLLAVLWLCGDTDIGSRPILAAAAYCLRYYTTTVLIS